MQWKHMPQLLCCEVSDINVIHTHYYNDTYFTIKQAYCMYDLIKYIFKILLLAATAFNLLTAPGRSQFHETFKA